MSNFPPSDPSANAARDGRGRFLSKSARLNLQSILSGGSQAPASRAPGGSQAPLPRASDGSRSPPIPSGDQTPPADPQLAASDASGASRVFFFPDSEGHAHNLYGDQAPASRESGGLSPPLGSQGGNPPALAPASRDSGASRASGAPRASGASRTSGGQSPLLGAPPVLAPASRASGAPRASGVQSPPSPSVPSSRAFGISSSPKSYLEAANGSAPRSRARVSGGQTSPPSFAFAPRSSSQVSGVQTQPPSSPSRVSGATSPSRRSLMAVGASTSRSNPRVSLEVRSLPDSFPDAQVLSDDLSFHSASGAPLDLLEASSLEALEAALADNSTDIRDLAAAHSELVSALSPPAPPHSSEERPAGPPAPSVVRDLLSAQAKLRSLGARSEQLSAAVASLKSSASDASWKEVRGQKPKRKVSLAPEPPSTSIRQFMVPVANRYDALRAVVDSNAAAFDARLAATKPRPKAKTKAIRADASVAMSSRARENLLASAGVLDADERGGVSASRRIHTDSEASADIDSLERDGNGYGVDGWVQPDDDVTFDPDYVPSGTEQSSSSRSRSHSRSSSRSRRSVSPRSQGIAKAMADFRASHIFYQRSDAPPVNGQAHVTSTVWRRTSRLRNLSSTIDEWLELPSVALLDADDVRTFVHHVSKVEPHYTLPLFVKLVTSFAHELQFLELLALCVSRSLPLHAQIFSEALYQSSTSHSALDAWPPLCPPVDRPSPPSTRGIYPPSAVRPVVMPTERPPRIADITDISALTSSFAFQYRAYERSHTIAGVQPLTMFDCLSHQQQKSFCLFCSVPQDRAALESNEQFLERCRETWGVKSTAGAISSLSAVRLKGDPLLRASWVTLQADFSALLDTIPQSAMPPAQSLVKCFIQTCDFDFMASSLTALRPRTWGAALTAALTLLQDVHFLNDARVFRARQHKPFDRRDRNDGRRDDRRHDGKPQRSAPVSRNPASRPEHRASRDRPQKQASASDRRPPAASPAAPRQPSSSSSQGAAVCHRCGKPGHTVSQCISRHHADGHILDQLPQEEYLANKARYRSSRDAPPRVNIISPATTTAPSTQPCRFCGAPVDIASMNDISAREARISGLCQACQDELFGFDAPPVINQAPPRVNVIDTATLTAEINAHRTIMSKWAADFHTFSSAFSDALVKFFAADSEATKEQARIHLLSCDAAFMAFTDTSPFDSSPLWALRESFVPTHMPPAPPPIPFEELPEFIRPPPIPFPDLEQVVDETSLRANMSLLREFLNAFSRRLDSIAAHLPPLAPQHSPIATAPLAAAVSTFAVPIGRDEVAPLSIPATPLQFAAIPMLRPIASSLPIPGSVAYAAMTHRSPLVPVLRPVAVFSAVLLSSETDTDNEFLRQWSRSPELFMEDDCPPSRGQSAFPPPSPTFDQSLTLSAGLPYHPTPTPQGGYGGRVGALGLDTPVVSAASCCAPRDNEALVLSSHLFSDVAVVSPFPQSLTLSLSPSVTNPLKSCHNSVNLISTPLKLATERHAHARPHRFRTVQSLSPTLWGRPLSQYIPRLRQTEGSSFYTALSNALMAISGGVLPRLSDHWLRTLVSRYIARHPDCESIIAARFRAWIPLITPDGPTYPRNACEFAREIARAGSFADELVVACCGDILDVNIVVVVAATRCATFASSKPRRHVLLAAFPGDQWHWAVPGPHSPSFPSLVRWPAPPPLKDDIKQHSYVTADAMAIAADSVREPWDVHALWMDRRLSLWKKAPTLDLDNPTIQSMCWEDVRSLLSELQTIAARAPNPRPASNDTVAPSASPHCTHCSSPPAAAAACSLLRSAPSVSHSISPNPVAVSSTPRSDGPCLRVHEIVRSASSFFIAFSAALHAAALQHVGAMTGIMPAALCRLLLCRMAAVGHLRSDRVFNDTSPQQAFDAQGCLCLRRSDGGYTKATSFYSLLNGLEDESTFPNSFCVRLAAMFFNVEICIYKGTSCVWHSPSTAALRVFLLVHEGHFSWMEPMVSAHLLPASARTVAFNFVGAAPIDHSHFRNAISNFLHTPSVFRSDQLRATCAAIAASMHSSVEVTAAATNRAEILAISLRLCLLMAAPTLGADGSFDSLFAVLAANSLREWYCESGLLGLAIRSVETSCPETFRAMQTALQGLSQSWRAPGTPHIAIVETIPNIPSVTQVLPSVEAASFLLPPPAFIGFVASSLNDALPPPRCSALCCEIDTGCSTLSVISFRQARRLGLKLTPTSFTATVATGAPVICKFIAHVVLTIFVNDAWLRFEFEAMVWDDLSHDLILCNKFALASGLIWFVHKNEQRIAHFGETAFSTRWANLLVNRMRVCTNNARQLSSSTACPHVATVRAPVTSDPSTSDTDPPTSDIDSELSTATVASVSSELSLLPPPSFYGFVGPTMLGTLPPPPASVLKCDVDTGCSSISVISSRHASRLGLKLKPSSITATVASGAKVRCANTAQVILTVFVNNSWLRFEFEAMVWDDLSHDLVLCNRFALDSGLIHFVHSNTERVAAFGDICFSHNWASLLASRMASLSMIDEEDVMSQELDESTNVGDVWMPPLFVDLSPSAQHFARMFPSFLRPIPEFADVRLPEWEAFASESALATYASPLKDKALLKPVRTSCKGADLIRSEFGKLRSLFFIEDAPANPHGVASRILLVAKPDGSTRVTVNCAAINKVMQIQAFPLPAVSEILHWIGRRLFRVKLDCTKGYHNFQIKESSRWITRTIGAGMAYQWRKCVQGIASTCSFFQWAMSTVLKDVLFTKCVIYLDDIFIAADTAELCSQYLLDVLRILNDYGIRLNFSKCVFTPSTDVTVLGCVIKGLSVFPSSSIQNTVAQIVHPNSHGHSKKKFSSLHHFLGLCAYLDAHCPGLKHILAPLYSAVSAPVWNWSSLEETAFGQAMQSLHSLQPFTLPSYAANAMLELHSDASDEAWSAVLWERRPDDRDDRSPKNLHLLAMFGGLFNDRQFKWPIVCKEMFALKEGIERSDHFIRLSPVRCIVDSKVLTYCSISKNPMMQRWYAYIQRYQLEFVHVSSETNVAADAISRLLHTFLPAKSPSTLRPSSVIVAPISPIVISSESSFDSPAAVATVTRTGLTTTPVPPGRRSQRRRTSPQSAAQPLSVRFVDASPIEASPPPARRRRAPAPPQLEPSQPAPAPASLPAIVSSPVFSGDLHDEVGESAVTLNLLVHATPTDGSCGPSSLLELLRDLFTNEDDFVQALPIDEQHLRDRLVDYVSTNADIPSPALGDQTFRAGIRADYVIGRRELRDSDYIRAAMEDNEDPVQHVNSFVGYTHAMRRPRAYFDEFMFAACAGEFNLQLCVLRHVSNTLMPTFYEWPGAAHRAIVLAANDHFEWCTQAARDPSSSLPRVSVTWFPPPLRRSLPRPAAPQDVPHLDDSLPMSPDRREIIARAHNALTGHPGRDATLASLRSAGYSWRGMFSQVSKFVDRCPSCQVSKRSAPIQAHLRTLRTSDRPCRRWHLDTVGPYPECSATAFKFISLFVDEVTGYTLLFGAKTKCALELAVSLIHLCGLFGLPDSFHTDGGSEFDTDVLHQFSALCSVRHNTSIARAPSTNGLAERQVQLAKRMLRQMSPVIGGASYWGLLIPLVQRAVNFLHRQDLGCCPQQFVFGLNANSDAFVIPCTPSPVSENANAEANDFHPAAGIMHAALRFQERTLQRVLEHRERQLESAISSRPAVPASTVFVGNLVLIPWRDNLPPTPLHARMCGPYTVTSVDDRTNTITLHHIADPPPVGQLLHTSWSLRAGVFPISDFDGLPIEDPSASHLVLSDTLPKPIDCILSCTLVQGPLPVPDTPAHARNHRFLVRWLGRPQSEASHVSYDDIKHSLACDRFCAANAFLLGHVSILRPPATFDPHVRPLPERPAQPPVPIAEAYLPESHDVLRVPAATRPHRGKAASNSVPSVAISPGPGLTRALRPPHTPPTPVQQPRARSTSAQRRAAQSGPSSSAPAAAPR